MKKYRLAILMSHPIHYLADLYKIANRHPDMEVMVYFCSDFGIKPGLDKTFGRVVKWYDENLLVGLPHKFLKNFSPSRNVGGQTLESLFSLINPGIISELRRNRYDAILIHGYVHLTSWLAIVGALLTKTPIIMKGDAYLLNYRNPFTKIIKKIVLARLFKKISAFLGLCKTNIDYYRYYGVPADKIFFTPYAVNNKSFQIQYKKLAGKKATLKRELGLNPQLPAILYSAKLIERKRPLDLLQAFEMIQKTTDGGAQLLFVGEGPEKDKLENCAEKLQIPNVKFFGFKKQSELPKFFAAADIFVQPSAIEIWGLATNEAMNFALPVITTSMSGTAYDIVQHNKNGFVYHPGNLKELKNDLQELILNEKLRKKMGRESFKIIKNWSCEKAVEGIVAAIKSIRKPCIIVANPGSHHLWRTAVALQNAGLLKSYATGVYFLSNKFPYNCLKIIPDKWKSKILEQFRKRNHEELNKSKIKTFGFYEWLYILSERLFKSKKLSHFLINIRNKNFSLKTGKLASKEISLIWYSLDGAREAFLIAKKRGVKCVLDQFIGHPLALNEILKKEIELRPELKRVTKDIISSQKLEKLCQEMQLADIIVVGSEFAKKTLIENGIPEDKTVVIPYGVDTKIFAAKSRATKNDLFNILFVGNISVRKGCHYLLQAIKEIDSPKLKLTMVGQMEDDYFLKKYGQYFEWVPQVSREQIPEFYAQADIYVYPSLFEGSSLSIYEALASGLPVITTENSGSVIRDKKDGFVIPIRDAQVIKEKVLRLYQDKNLRKKMSASAQERAEHFTWQIYQDRVAALTEKILKQTNG